MLEVKAAQPIEASAFPFVQKHHISKKSWQMATCACSYSFNPLTVDMHNILFPALIGMSSMHALRQILQVFVDIT